jgi:uncharacterized protein YndB with AHSA1/START domain
MFGPDGQAYPNHVVFDEVAAPSRLVLRYVAAPGSDQTMHVTTIDLDPLAGDRTRITLTVRLPTPEVRQAAAERGAVEGGEQTLSRLATLLERGLGAPEEQGVFLVRRVLRAPPELVWRAWTDAAHLARWFSPSVWSITHPELELRVGGTWFYGFAGPDFPQMWALWRFVEVDPPRRLVFHLSFANADRQLVASPFGGAWPARVATTVTLERHAGPTGGTLLTLRQVPHEATEEETAAFVAMLPGMAGGWGQTIDSLVAFLAGEV